MSTWMQIVMAWVIGSPLVAVLVGKMIALGDRRDAVLPVTVGAGSVLDRFEPAPARLGTGDAA